MAISDVGLTRSVVIIAADIVDGRAGTGTTLPTPADTDLETVVVDTEFDVDVVTSNNTFSITHVIPSTDGNSNDLTEWQIRMNSEATQLSRVVTAPVTKTTSIDVTKITLFDLIGE